MIPEHNTRRVRVIRDVGVFDSVVIDPECQWSAKSTEEKRRDTDSQ